MARQESDREDLMREATAFYRRVEFRCARERVPVFGGYRRTGAFSLYYGADPVYQFDPEGKLRRAYAEGQLFRTQGTTLARLTRCRTERETRLIRENLSAEELIQFYGKMKRRLQRTIESIESGTVEVVRQIPTELDLLPPITAFLHKVLSCESWLAPRIIGKR